MLYSDRPDPDHLLDSFAARVTAEGFVFRQSVKRCILELQADDEFAWRLEAARVPLPRLHRDDRVELIFAGRQRPALVVVTTAWVDAPRGAWAFARDTCAKSDDASPVFRHDRVVYRLPNVPILTRDMVRDAFRVAAVAEIPLESDVYHLGMMLPRGQEPPARSRSLEDALASACRHHNALLDYLEANRKLMGIRERLDVIPVVVTNADLYGCDADLSTGSPEAQPNLSQWSARPWVWFQHAQAHEDLHRCRRTAYPESLAEAIDTDYRRTIPIISADHLGEALRAIEQKLEV